MGNKNLEICVISDIHLATYACNAKLLLGYLKSIKTEMLILNGDFIDSWRFSRNYFPKPHLKVIRQIIKMMEQGTRVIYITGNHDEIFRKFDNTCLGNFQIANQLELNLNGKKTWIIHGDIFDNVVNHAKWLAKLGAAAYGFITILNRLINAIGKPFRKNEINIYRTLKSRIRKNKQILTRFEMAIGKISSIKKYNTVICGHTHVPADKTISTNGYKVRYINCGDWVEHFTAAEYNNGEWSLSFFPETGIEHEAEDLSATGLFPHSLLEEYTLANIV